MLYSYYGASVSQDAIAESIGDVKRITQRGCSVDELAQAVNALTPGFILLGKMCGTLDDLRLLTEQYCIPVGVEWRGRFLEPDGTIWEEGHYSLVTRVNDDANMLEVIDPYGPGVNLLSLNDQIPIDVFTQRWWDTNPLQLSDDPNDVTEVRDEQLLFVLVPQAQVGAMRSLQLYPMMVAYMR
jgi:hypothetical protein